MYDMYGVYVQLNISLSSEDSTSLVFIVFRVFKHGEFFLKCSNMHKFIKSISVNTIYVYILICKNDLTTHIYIQAASETHAHFFLFCFAPSFHTMNLSYSPIKTRSKIFFACVFSSDVFVTDSFFLRLPPRFNFSRSSTFDQTCPWRR